MASSMPVHGTAEAAPPPDAPPAPPPAPHPAPPSVNSLPLPGELIDAILDYLSPFDLAAVAQVCRSFHAHATAERIWHKHVQANVPGTTITTPYPCTSFRDLYAAHEPRWFLTKHKIWFSGRDMIGKILIMRYDQRRGCIEGYQMLAVSHRITYHHWPPDDNVVVHAFEPEISLHLDRPVLKLEVHSPASPVECAKPLENGTTRLTMAPSGFPALMTAAPAVWNWRGEGAAARAEAVGADTVDAVDAEAQPSTTLPEPTSSSRLREVPMLIDGGTGADHVHQTFMFAQPLAIDQSRPYTAPPFPYDNTWPSASVPANHRVMAANFPLDRYPVGQIGRPLRRADISDQAFHIRTWFDVNSPVSFQEQRIAGLGVDEIDTFSTLDPLHYTPTADKPFRGIWVGDYSGHGCEFLLIHQPEDRVPFDETSMQRLDGESDEAFAKRRHDARIYRGRLEAIKLTGDPNVPRGEYSFLAEDIGDAGLDYIMQVEPFPGVRIVRSLGHVAGTGFRNERYVESRLILISPNRLAQYWMTFGHISFFERVDIDQFLQPN